MTTYTTKSGAVAHRVPRHVTRADGYRLTRFVWRIENGLDGDGVTNYRSATAAEARHLNTQVAQYGGPNHPSYRPS